jgi:RNA polymerase-binding transcription factor DksA
MPDAMDAVQTFNDEHTADALQRHAQRKVAPGRTHCAYIDCREPIFDARRLMGAQLCLACQQEEEARNAHLLRWKQR